MGFTALDRLSLRIALPFGLVILVTAGLWLWGLIVWKSGAERRDLEAVAQTNAAFLRQVPMTLTPMLAAQLRRVLGMEVSTEPPAGWSEPKPDGRARRLPDGRDSVGVRVREGETLWLSRRPSPVLEVLRSPLAIVVLGTLLLPALALAWTVRRVVVRPLARMAFSLQRWGPGWVPEAALVRRGDEIGQLARGLRDAGERIRAEREARERAERLALLGRMSAAMAHEVNNPLASIRMHAELAGEESPGSAASLDSLRWIREGTERIEWLVNQWMFLANPAPAGSEPVHLGAAWGRVIDLHAPAARERGVRVETALDANRKVRGDRRRLEQAFANLLLNAVQASPSGGTIWITDSPLPDGGVGIQVQDQGPGFSLEALERGFEPFWSGRPGGTGIGLSVVDEVVRACGGRVRLENVPEVGARAILEWPRSEGGEEAHP